MLGGDEAEDDVALGNAGGFEFEGDGITGSVILDPNFLVANIEMKDRSVDVSLTFPTETNDLEMVLCGIDDFLGNDAVGS